MAFMEKLLTYPNQTFRMALTQNIVMMLKYVNTK